MLQKLKAGAVHMRQVHLLWLIRLVLYKRSKDKKASFLHRDAAKRARRAAAAGAAPDSAAPAPAPPASSADDVKAALGGDDE